MKQQPDVGPEGVKVGGRDLDELRQFAMELARGADSIITGHRARGEVASSRKSDGTPVTETDAAIERYLHARIKEEFPDDGIQGEELPAQAGGNGWTWHVDPIDGTRAYVSDVPLYSTLVGLEFEGVQRVGVAHFPALGETVSAAAGVGCFRGRSRVRVRETVPADGMYVMTSELRSWPPDAISRLLDSGANLRTWGDAYGYAMVATGRADAMVDCDARTYDLAAVAVIITEAGGTFMSLDGVEAIDRGTAVGASSGEIGDQVRRFFL